MPLSPHAGEELTGGADEIPGYRLLEPVGQGGFSVVYRAHQTALDRLVAVKLLSVDYVDQRARKRFLREVRLTTRLSGHPHVVTVLDAGVTRSRRPYLVMDFFEQGSLSDRLDAQGPLPATEVAQIGFKVCSALAAAHGHGILHRDIKPQNILVSRFGEPALADFGIALLLDSAAHTSRTDALTPYHAAPEVLDGEQPGPAADIYSLGSTLYQLLAGHPAHRNDGGGIAPMLLRIMNEPPPPLARPDLPGFLREAVLRAMAKQPGDRFASAAGFASALGAVTVAAPGIPDRTAASLPGGHPAPGSAPVPGSAPAPGPTAAPTVLRAAARQSPARTLPEEPGMPPAWAGAAPQPAGTVPAPPPQTAQTAAFTDPSKTVARPGRELPGQQAAGGGHRRGWRRWQLITGIGVAAVVVATGAALRAGLWPAAPPHARPSPQARHTGGTAAQSAGARRSQLAAARPAAVAVTDEGTEARLRWRNPPGTDYPIFVEIRPRPSAGGLLSAGTGAVSATVSGLNPGAGYCFTVGAVVAFGNPSTVAWSHPACIRGATAGRG